MSLAFNLGRLELPDAARACAQAIPLTRMGGAHDPSDGMCGKLDYPHDRLTSEARDSLLALLRTEEWIVHMAPPVVRRWSTDDVAHQDRLPYWVDGVSQGVFGVSCIPSDPRQFRGTVAVAPLDALTVTVTSASARVNKRARADVANDTNYYFYVLVGFDAGWSVNWRGNPIELGAGDLFFGDTRHVQSATMPRSITAILLPPDWISTWLRNPERLAGHCVRRDEGWGTALSTFIERLSPASMGQLSLPHKVMADNIGTLLALTEAELWADGRQATERRLVDLVSTTIRQRASEIGLTAAEIARSLDVSERTLHRSFADCQQSFAGLLLHTRLDLAQRMLASKHLRRLSTGEIGRRAGFADPSHFVRAMSRHVGTTPARFRNAILGESADREIA